MGMEQIYSGLWRSIFRVFGLLDDVQRHMGGAPSQLGALSVAQSRVLRILWTLQEEHPGGVKLKELAERLRIGPAAASEMVDVLCRKHLLCCEPCADDRRAVSIRFADGVADREGEADAAFSLCVQELCADFTDGELQLLSRMLERMSRNGQKLSL